MHLEKQLQWIILGQKKGCEYTCSCGYQALMRIVKSNSSLLKMVYFTNCHNGKKKGCHVTSKDYKLHFTTWEIDNDNEKQLEVIQRSLKLLGFL